MKRELTAMAKVAEDFEKQGKVMAGRIITEAMQRIAQQPTPPKTMTPATQSPQYNALEGLTWKPGDQSYATSMNKGNQNLENHLATMISAAKDTSTYQGQHAYRCLLQAVQQFIGPTGTLTSAPGAAIKGVELANSTKPNPLPVGVPGQPAPMTG